MKYFDRVRSTLKKGCDVQLGAKTVICGPNGSGKSTIVQSLEIAANGWASDMEGRPRVKLPSALGRLFPTNDRTVMARLNDGTVYDWELMDGTKPGSLRKPWFASLCSSTKAWQPSPPCAMPYSRHSTKI